MTHSSQLIVETHGQNLILDFSGRLDAQGVAPLWHQAVQAVAKSNQSTIQLNLDKISYLDMAGATFISHLKDVAVHQVDGLSIHVTGLKKEFVPLLTLAEKAESVTDQLPAEFSMVEKAGQNLAAQLADIKNFIGFIGEITWAMVTSLKTPGRIRWAETFMVAERSGVDALPIVALISFIVGLVMAFQAAIPMKMFGA